MGIRNGQQFLASLLDDRQVIYDGRRVEDVVNAPGLSMTARAVAQFYDFQSLPENAELMTFKTPEGGLAGMAFKEARTKDDLRQRAAAYAAWAETTCGFMGRSPDYMNTLLTTLGSVSPLLAEVDPRLASRARGLYLDARDRDLCYTHTFAEPFKVVPAPSEQPERPCRVVTESSEGLVITGARALATLAPFANMNFDLPGGAWYERDGTPYLCGFVTQVAAPGLRWICRDKMGGDRSHSDSPLAARLDEMDCVAIFEDCLIPWENVYMFAPLSVETPAMEFVMAGLQHHVLVRSIAKARFLVGLATLIAESSRVNQFINIQERLGEMVCWLRTLEAFAVAAVEDAYFEPVTGVYHPNPQTTEVAGIWCAQMFPKMVDHLLDIGGSRHVAATQQRTVELLGDLAEQHFRGSGASASETVGLFRLAWEVAGSTWGSRHDLYERFHFGDATLRKVGGYLRFDSSEAVAMVRRILTVPPRPGEVFPVSSPAATAAGSQEEVVHG
jgi:aromatic ring hydroxylase